MEENIQANSQQPTADFTPEGTGGQGEKLFTQADVDRIIGERLKRVKAEKQDTAELEAREKALTDRESALRCREFLLERSYPAELLDVFDTTDAEKFEQIAEKAYTVIRRACLGPAPLGDTEPPIGDEAHAGIRGAFAPGRKHSPRDYGPYFPDEE